MPVKLYLVGDEAGKTGDRDTKRAQLDTIRSLNLDEVTSHLPFLSFRHLMDLALKSDLFLAPSVTAADGDAEGTPFVLQQMMATGMPAIATTHTDIPYLFGELGDSLVPERDVPAIARRLQHYADTPRRSRMTGRRWARASDNGLPRVSVLGVWPIYTMWSALRDHLSHRGSPNWT